MKEEGHLQQLKNLMDVLARYAYEWREQPFTLKSGQKSHDYVDCRRVLLHPRHLSLATDVISHLIYRYFSPNAVAGILVGGAPLVSAVSMRTGYPGVWVRPEAKEHGSKKRVELACSIESGKDLPRGVLLLDDVITTGGSVLSSILALVEEDIYVAGVLALVDRGQGGARLITDQSGVPVRSVCTLDDLIKIAEHVGN